MENERMFDYNKIMKPITLDDIEETFNRMQKNLKPIAVKIEVLPDGYNFIKENADCSNEKLSWDEELKNRNELGLSLFYGVELVVVYNDNELKNTQARIIYSDGSSKIINLAD